MKRVLYDNIIFSLQRSGGISMVWSGLLSSMACKGVVESLYLEYAGSEENLFRRLLRLESSKKLKSKAFPLQIERYVSPRYEPTDVDIFHSSYYRVVSDRDIKNVVTLHDFTYENVYGKYSLARQVHHRQKMHSLRKADKIVCVSRNTYEDLLRYYPTVDSSRVEVVYNGVSNSYYKMSQRDVSDYVLYVGARGGYKNFDFVVDALSGTNYKLLIAGSALTVNERRMIRHKLREGQVIVKINPDEEELNRIYNNAYCLAYPSSNEGFGLPIIEAQKAGCPVIGLRGSSVTEVIGDTPMLLNELSVSEFRDKMRLLSDCRIREDIEANGLCNSSRFSPERMSQHYAEIYTTLK